MCISRKQFGAPRLDLVSLGGNGTKMSDRIAENIDPKASKVVAEAIGERLRADVQPEESKLPFRLQQLLDQLRAQDDNT